MLDLIFLVIGTKVKGLRYSEEVYSALSSFQVYRSHSIEHGTFFQYLFFKN